MSVDDLTPQEIAAALAARRELGPEYEHEIAASMAERFERQVAAQVAARSGASLAPSGTRSESLEIEQAKTSRRVGIGSLIAGASVTIAVTGSATSDSRSVLVTWLGIAVVNLAVNLGGRRHRR
jgi:hypothetical protein